MIYREALSILELEGETILLRDDGKLERLGILFRLEPFHSRDHLRPRSKEGIIMTAIASTEPAR